MRLLRFLLTPTNGSASDNNQKAPGPESLAPRKLFLLTRRQFIALAGVSVANGGAVLGAIRRPVIPLRSSAANLTVVFGAGEQTLEEAAASQMALDLGPQDSSWVEVPIFSTEVLRPEDLLALRFEFTNLLLRARKKDRSIIDILLGKAAKREIYLARLDPNKPALITAHFPPQHVAEEAFYEAADPNQSDKPSPPGQVKSKLSGPSRLSFRIPDATPTLPYNFETLLDWAKYELSVAPTALPNGEVTGARIKEPDSTETYIEFPYRLILSPSSSAGWAHAASPVSRRSIPQSAGQQPEGPPPVTWTELWHTRLAVRNDAGDLDEDNEFYRTVRAIWSKDLGGSNARPEPCRPRRKPTDPGSDFLMSVDARDRSEIVQLSSNFNDLERLDENTGQWAKYEPLPIKVRKLILTSLGATIFSDGAWPTVRYKDGRGALSVREWHHESSLGRDQYVRVVYGGYLYPYGHRCNLVQITERKFQKANSDDPNAPVAAYLRQQITISVEEPVRTYGSSGLKVGLKSVDRMMPFRTIEVATLVTPPLDRPEDSVIAVPGVPDGVCAFWPRVGGKDFLFHLVKVDSAGNRSECTTPAIFVVYPKSEDPGAMGVVQSVWRNSKAGRRDMAGQKVAYVPSRDPGDTTYETHEVNFDAHLRPPVWRAQQDPSDRLLAAAAITSPAACELPGEPGPAPWQTIIADALIKIPAVEQIIGAGKSLPIEWDDNYLEKGFDLNLPLPNKGELFAKVRDSLRLSLPDSRSVGLVKPEFDITGLSRRFGSVGGDLAALSRGVFDARKLLDGVSAKILGVIDLIKVLRELVSFETDGGGEKVPKVITRTILNDVGLPMAIESRMQWFPELKDWTENSFAKFIRLPGSSLSLEVLVLTDLQAGGATTYQLTGVLSKFEIKIVNAIAVDFDRLSFVSRSGQKPDVDVDISQNGVLFGGALAFVNKLQAYLSKSLFGDQGPTIILTPRDVTVSVAFMLPTIAVGAFSLQNIRMSARLFLPFKGDTPVTLRVAFGERHDTFLVQATFLGGGGFLAIYFGLDRIISLEAAIEFGGVVALSIGVAEGNAYILGGIYLYYELGKGAALTGYVRHGGALRVLGLVTVSVEFYMGLTYNSCTGKVYGEASVTVRIEVLFFSKEVKLTVYREFVGGKGDCSLSSAVAGMLPRSAEDEQAAPKFKDFMEQGDWNLYCDSFAASV